MECVRKGCGCVCCWCCVGAGKGQQSSSSKSNSNSNSRLASTWDCVSGTIWRVESSRDGCSGADAGYTGVGLDHSAGGEDATSSTWQAAVGMVGMVGMIAMPCHALSGATAQHVCQSASRVE